jgi:hypothetical protein
MTTPIATPDVAPPAPRLRVRAWALALPPKPQALGLLAAEPTAAGCVHVTHRLTTDPAES